MASLALVVTLMFLGILFVGPIIYVVCLLPFLPKLLKQLLAIISIGLGIYWLFLPVSVMRLIGLLPVFCGLKILDNCKLKQGDEHHE